MTISIVIADDHAVLRSGLRGLLALEADFRVIGEAPDGHAAIRISQALKPDVLLADVSMPGPDGFEIARTLREKLPSTAVLIVTMHEDAGLVREALRAGAKGYLPKRALESELIRAIRVVAGGGIYATPDWLPKHAASPGPEQTPAFDDNDLNPTELNFLRQMVQGQTAGQIGRGLGLSADAMADLRRRFAERLGLYSRAAYVRYARQHRLM